MNTPETTRAALLKGKSPAKKTASGEQYKFVPKGAIAFFIALVLLSLVIWYGIYFLMLERI